jgi:hypothetical protein
MSEDMDKDIKKMATLIRNREFRERELLIACFVLENPDVPVEEIVFITHMLKDGGVAYQVRKVEDLDYEGEHKIH